MQKAKWLMSGFMLGLMLLLFVLAWYELSLGSSLCITEKLFCWSDKPPYTKLCHEYHWWINVTVTATEDLDNVIVSDRFGAEFKIESITIGEPQKGSSPTYAFVNHAYEAGASSNVTKGEMTGYATGSLDENGVTFDGFHVYWMVGKSIETYFEWRVGSLSAGETVNIFIAVSTTRQLNPSRDQEFTSYGTYFLDSGAKVSGVKKIWMMLSWQISSESHGVKVEVTKS